MELVEEFGVVLEVEHDGLLLGGFGFFARRGCGC